MKSKGVLYLSYDGLMEPLGQSQVLTYLAGMATDPRFHFVLITFEKPSDWAKISERKELLDQVKNLGIRWVPLTYHKSPTVLATAYDIFRATVFGFFLILRHRVKIVHARSYVASVPAIILKSLTRVRFVFDMRGFWADERVDGGLWNKDSALYRTAKYFEKQFLTKADSIVSLTHAAVKEMKTFDYLDGAAARFTVIPTCVDVNRFVPAQKLPAGRGAPFTLGYVGSVDQWYLFSPAVKAFRSLQKKRPGARFLIVNRAEHDYIRKCLEEEGVDLQTVTIESVPHSRIHERIQEMDAAVFFLKAAYSKIASAPTKLAEFLGCGIPCLSNRGVGDMAEILESTGVGVVAGSLDAPGIEKGVTELLSLARDSSTSDRCAAVARNSFSAEAGIKSYLDIYEGLLRAEKSTG